MLHGQLTLVKKVSADQYHVSISRAWVKSFKVTYFYVDRYLGAGFNGSQVQARLIYCNQELRF